MDCDSGAVRAAAVRAGQEHVTKLIGCASVRRSLWPHRPLSHPLLCDQPLVLNHLSSSPHQMGENSCSITKPIGCAIREGNQPCVLCALHCMARSRRQGSVLADGKKRGGFAWWSTRTSTVDRARCAKSGLVGRHARNLLCPGRTFGWIAARRRG